MHRTILMVLYASGLCRTEASRLKVSDIDSQRMVIHVARGKGLRDRDVPLTPSGRRRYAITGAERSHASIFSQSKVGTVE